MTILKNAWQASRKGNLSTYLSQGFWNSTSRFGERIGSPTLIYNPGIFRFFHQKAMENAPGFTRIVRKHFPEARSVVDLGCGTGVYLHEFQKLGLQVGGMEYSPRGRKKAKEAFGLEIRAFDLNHVVDSNEFDRRFDLAMSIEVGEHLPEHMGENLVASLCRLADTVIFTAAQPGDGGTAHINERPSSYWVERFQKQGFTLDSGATRSLADEVKADKQITAAFLWKNILILRRVAA